MPFSSGTTVRYVGLREVDAKLLAAAPRIFETNWAAVTATLNATKAEVQSTTPTGPGHFGYHLKDTYKVGVSNRGWTVTGKLTGAVQGYWREFGTKGRSRGMARGLSLSVGQLSKAYKQGAVGGGGEKAGMYAHKALAGFRHLIREFYAGSPWWRL